MAQELIVDLLDERSDRTADSDDQNIQPADNHNARPIEAGAGSQLTDRAKTPQPAPPPGGLFSKNRFGIDLGADTVTCPGAVTTPIRWHHDRSDIATLAPACADCPLRGQCTTSTNGRTVTINAHEDVLARARRRQTGPDWPTDYQATRPKAERTLGHLMHRRHGGRNARVGDKTKIDADFRLLAATTTNLARMAVLGLHFTPTNGWITTA